MTFVWVAKQRKQQETYTVRWARTRSQFVQYNIGSIGLRVVTSNSMILMTLWKTTKGGRRRFKSNLLEKILD